MHRCWKDSYNFNLSYNLSNEKFYYENTRHYSTLLKERERERERGGGTTILYIYIYIYIYIVENLFNIRFRDFIQDYAHDHYCKLLKRYHKNDY